MKVRAGFLVAFGADAGLPRNDIMGEGFAPEAPFTPGLGPRGHKNCLDRVSSLRVGVATGE